MSDLTDEEMGVWERLIRPGADNVGRAHEALLEAFAEIRRHRAARAADGVRVRAVVESEVSREMGQHDNDSIQEADWSEMREAIASRVADQLAPAHPDERVTNLEAALRDLISISRQRPATGTELDRMESVLHGGDR